MTTDEAKTVIAERIDEALARIGWTRYKLAQVTGISHATMHNICNGIHDPKSSNLKSIADALGVTVDHLLSDAQTSTKKSGRKVRASA